MSLSLSLPSFLKFLKGLGISNPIKLIRFIKCEASLTFLRSPFPKGYLILFTSHFKYKLGNAYLFCFQSVLLPLRNTAREITEEKWLSPLVQHREYLGLEEEGPVTSAWRSWGVQSHSPGATNQCSRSFQIFETVIVYLFAILENIKPPGKA